MSRQSVSSANFILVFIILAVCILTLMHRSNGGTSNIQNVLFNQMQESVPKAVYNDQKMKDLRRESFLVAEQAKRELLGASRGSNHDKFYELLRMEAYCPRKIRVGESGDGGKIVCNPEKAKDNCTMMSLGLNDQVEYDMHIQNLTNHRCNILGADIGEQKIETKEIYKKIRGQVFVGNIPNSLTISDVLRKGGNSEVEMLKIDIESSEHTALEPFLKETFVCQIFIEIHGKPAEHLNLLQKINKLGFRMFSYEPNIYCKPCCEYSFINEMCMAQYDVVPLALTIPLVSEAPLQSEIPLKSEIPVAR